MISTEVVQNYGNTNSICLKLNVFKIVPWREWWGWMMIIALWRNNQFMLNDWNTIPSISTLINNPIVKSRMFLFMDIIFKLKVHTKCCLPSIYKMKARILPLEHYCTTYSVSWENDLTSLPFLHWFIYLEGIASTKSLPVMWDIICKTITCIVEWNP